MTQLISGAEFDTRTQEQKAKDYKFAELVASANPVNWVEKKPASWRKFPIFNQNGSGSCVAQTEAKEMGIMRWAKDGNYVHFSATDIYQRRANKPAGGMGAINAREIAQKGVTLEVLAPSQALSDSQMDSAVVEPYKREVGSVFSVPNYVELPAGDIDTIASFIQTTGKGAMVWFYFQYDEWTDRPLVISSSLELILPSTIRHSVTAVDFALVDGKKSLIIEDSWGPNYGLNGQRVISEEFFKARNWFAGYLMNFKFDEAVIDNKPKHWFKEGMVMGDKNKEVEALQAILKYEGLFPANTQMTGYYGAITSKAVLAWQKKYEVAPNDELENLAGRVVGPKTLEKLNQVYG